MKRNLLVVSLLLLSLAIGSYAADKKSDNVTFYDPVKIGSTTLQPGDYKVVWDGTGPDVQVSFVQGKKTVASAPARLTETSKNAGKAVSLRTESDSSRVVTEIAFKKVSLRFDESAPAAGN
ncbi:MAG: hypothetical protein L0Z53_25055 [Acidobacteriales bacterium]|nr:hypothetical protein [Terriglobales bacterium]